MKARPADYLNCMLERELDVSNQSPARLRNTDNSLSFSLTQKESNFKYLPDLLDSQRRSDAKNKENRDARDDAIDLFSLQKQNPEPTQQHRYSNSNSMLNEELVLLQSKLSNLEEKFLNMSTPEKARKTGKSGHFRKSQNQPTANTKSFVQPRRPNNDNTVKRREGANGKIQSTTRFSVVEKKSSRDGHIGHFNRAGSKESNNRVLNDHSIDSMRSIQRSKDKEIHQLKLEVSRCKNVCQSSRVKKERIENELDLLKEKVMQYKILERRQKEMLHENQRLTKQLHKSEVIREKQKKMIAEFRLELKELKQAASKKKQ